MIKQTEEEKEELQKALQVRQALKIRLQGQLSSLNKECDRIKRENERLSKELIGKSRLFNKRLVPA